MSVTIGPATVSDLEAVAGIYAHYVTGSVATFEEVPPTVDQWRQRLGQGFPFLVATIDDEVVGYACASPWRPKPAYRYTLENSVYLAPGRTGRGVGRALMEALLDACGKAGAREVIAVIADTGDDASQALHRRLGFTHAGRLTAVGHKHGRWIDTVLMQRTLGA
jgi:L-amino acid N-acyltransferase YncA